MRRKPAGGGEPTRGGTQWQVSTALTLGGILMASGVVLFVAAHWDELGSGARFAVVCAAVSVLHLAGGFARTDHRALSTALHALGTIAAGPAIALAGQIFGIEEHWPATVLLWTLAALAGWAVLRDQAQQVLALMLVPTWMLAEIGDRARGFIGAEAYMGRLCFVWAILYITFFLGSGKKAVRAILFAASATAAAVGVPLMLSNWEPGIMTLGFLPFGLRVIAWVAIAGVPLVVAAFHGHKGLIPIALAIAFVLALPWCEGGWRLTNGTADTVFIHRGTGLPAYLLVAAFALFLCWWGARLVSRALINLGIAGFAAAVIWFYLSDVMSKSGKSLGLIGLGLLFLVGGWALERTRRRILARMPSSPPGHAKPPIVNAEGAAQ